MIAYHAREVGMVALMVFGFGFVVFFHELGHFLAAKWVGIKVEQFAVGFGQALFAFRKGIGWKVGSTHPEYLKRIEKHLAGPNSSDEKPEYTDEQIAKAADDLGLGETEYRLNWVPLGGYVKMLGQDDLKPNAGVSDPRAYNRKGVGQRMIVVSAGVIMNIILAGIGFMAIFLMGFKAPAPVAGKVLTNSPADVAGIQPGDRIMTIDGVKQYDFARVVLSTALLKEDRDVTIEAERFKPDGTRERKTFTLRPARMVEDDPRSFLGIGVQPSDELRGVEPLPTWKQADEDKYVNEPGRLLPDIKAIKAGDTIVAIQGKPLSETGDGPDTVKYGYVLLWRAFDSSGGKPVAITVRDKNNKTREEQVPPRIEIGFGSRAINIAGMEPRPRVQSVPEETSVAGKLMAGDVITAIRYQDNDEFINTKRVRELTKQAGTDGKALTITVLRDGKKIVVGDLVPKTKVDKQQKGLGIGLDCDESPVVSQVVENSPAKRAGVVPGTMVKAIDDKPIDSWFQVRDVLASAGDHKLSVVLPHEGGAKDLKLTVTATDAEAVAHSLHAMTYLPLRDLQEIRKTSSPTVAMGWGVIETRDLILQFYVTIARMFQGSVSYANMMGPLGIVTSGAQFAMRGMDWLIWFLAMISANLAVVNFLPIPIVDGGLFTFLILEKIQGKPLSPKAQAIAQVVGFALIISVFLLVTYQDIRRTIGL